MKKNTTDQSLNPLVRAVEEANLEGVFEELGIPKPKKKLPPRIRMVRKTQSKGREQEKN